MQAQLQKRQEAEDIKKNLMHKLELHRDTIEHRHRDVDAVSKNLEIEKDKKSGGYLITAFGPNA